MDLLAGKPELRCSGPRSPPARAAAAAEPEPKRKPAEGPRPLPAPGLAGGAAELRRLVFPKKPELA